MSAIIKFHARAVSAEAVEWAREGFSAKETTEAICDAIAGGQ